MLKVCAIICLAILICSESTSAQTSDEKNFNGGPVFILHPELRSDRLRTGGIQLNSEARQNKSSSRNQPVSSKEKEYVLGSKSSNVKLGGEIQGKSNSKQTSTNAGGRRELDIDSGVSIHTKSSDVSNQKKKTITEIVNLKSMALYLGKIFRTYSYVDVIFESVPDGARVYHSKKYLARTNARGGLKIEALESLVMRHGGKTCNYGQMVRDRKLEDKEVIVLRCDFKGNG